MRTRTYHCNACGHKWEREQPMSDPVAPLYRCPQCNQLTGTARPRGWGKQVLRFRGKGWTGTSKGDDRV